MNQPSRSPVSGLVLLLSLLVLAGAGTVDSAAASDLESALLVPYFAVDRDAPEGITALFAVRNRSDETVTVLIQYFRTSTAPTGIPDVEQVETLLPQQVRTVNLRDVVDVPNNGYLIASVVEAGTLTPLPSKRVLTGDFFLVESAEDFASGELMVGLSPVGEDGDKSGLCNRWDQRYFQGGAFSGGTDFIFFVEENIAGSGSVVEGDLYDEAGNFVTTLGIRFPGHSTTFNSTVLPEPPLNINVPFGVIEWRFTGDARGYISSVLKADGRFSVGFSGSCVDPVAE